MTQGAHSAWTRDARVVVFGCGGVGGTVAAALARTTTPYVVVTNNSDITQAIAERGLIAHADGVQTVTRPAVVTRAAALPPGPFKVALLAVPPNRLEEVARDALARLAPDGYLVPLANGLPEERVSALPGEAPGGGDLASRVVGSIVGFGASMRGPGEVERTSDGSFTIGTLDGVIDARAERVHALMSTLGQSNLTSNLRGARWSKLAINCAISSLGTLGGDRLGALMRHRFVRRLFLEVISEATAVAVKAGVSLEKVSGTIDLEWLALTDEERVVAGSASLLAKHTLLLAVGARFRRLRSSMLAALERGREPPVDFLNGEVVSAGARLGIATPVNAAVVEAVRGLARREHKPGLDRLEALFQATRSTDRAAA